MAVAVTMSQRDSQKELDVLLAEAVCDLTFPPLHCFVLFSSSSESVKNLHKQKQKSQLRPAMSEVPLEAGPPPDAPAFDFWSHIDILNCVIGTNWLYPSFTSRCRSNTSLF